MCILKHINMAKIISPRLISGTSGSNLVEILNKNEIQFELRAMQNYKPPYFIDTSLQAEMCPKGLRNLLGEPDILNRHNELLTFYAFYEDKNHSIIGNYVRKDKLLVERTRIYSRHR